MTPGRVYNPLDKKVTPTKKIKKASKHQKSLMSCIRFKFREDIDKEKESLGCLLSFQFIRPKTLLNNIAPLESEVQVKLNQDIMIQFLVEQHKLLNIFFIFFVSSLQNSILFCYPNTQTLLLVERQIKHKSFPSFKLPGYVLYGSHYDSAYSTHPIFFWLLPKSRKCFKLIVSKKSSEFKGLYKTKLVLHTNKSPVFLCV